MRQAWLICASLSIAAHALAVTLLPDADHQAIRGSLPHRPVVWHARIAEAVPSPARMTPTTAPMAGQEQLPPIEPSEPVSNQATAQEEADTPVSPPANQQDVAEAATQTKPAPEATPQSNAGGEPDSEYVPRPQLTVAPVAEAPVLVTPPPGLYPPERITGILSLFIDETGHVNRIVSSGPAMPPEFEALAKQAFMTTTFRPGQVDGQVVKSRIRVEVVFDNTPLLGPTPLKH